MNKNVGGFDKIFRVILGVVILLVGMYYQSWLGLIGIVPLATGLLGWCPLYLPCGLNSCKIKENQKETNS